MPKRKQQNVARYDQVGPYRKGEVVPEEAFSPERYAELLAVGAIGPEEGEEPAPAAEGPNEPAVPNTTAEPTPRAETPLPPTDVRRASG